MYEITTPGGAKYLPPEGRCWKNIESEFLKQVEDGRIWFGVDGNSIPRRKTYLSEREGKNVWSWWDNKSVGHSQEATKEIVKIFGTSTVFDYAKPVRLVQRIVQIATKAKGSIVLDSFAGSGTTAHAVINMNKEDGGDRKYILVEMMDYADTVTAERVKRVINGYGEGNKHVDGIDSSFSFFDLGEPLMIDGNINPEVSANKIREYIYYTETKQATVIKNDEPYYLGTAYNTAYYFNYEKDSATTLDYEFLSTIRTRAEAYVIYADTCNLSENELATYHITFKKIPRDIRRF